MGGGYATPLEKKHRVTYCHGLYGNDTKIVYPHGYIPRDTLETGEWQVNGSLEELVEGPSGLFVKWDVRTLGSRTVRLLPTGLRSHPKYRRRDSDGSYVTRYQTALDPALEVNPESLGFDFHPFPGPKQNARFAVSVSPGTTFRSGDGSWCRNDREDGFYAIRA